ncbi:hypothetical protein [Tenacibaculum sp. 190524A02b]|uniref:BppU N-terminal domain-containing protein n=1 Tax=Tenacibaculum vairaonense TaxID=3137860 RepID=A0ABM9PRK3_9FLAO
MENTTILYSDIVKEFKVQKISEVQTPITINNHVSLGPFVRITQTGSENYIYTTSFFDSNTIKGGCEEFHIDPIISSKKLTIKIKSKKTTDIHSKKQGLFSLIFTIDDDTFNAIKQIKVEIDFNSKSNEPTRGTVVIPPGSTL